MAGRPKRRARLAALQRDEASGRRRDEKRASRFRVNFVDQEGVSHSLLVNATDAEDAIAAVRARPQRYMIFRVLSVLEQDSRTGPYAAGYSSETPEAAAARARLEFIRRGSGS